MSYADDLALAHELADIADAIALPRFMAQDLQVETKPDDSPVTDADRATERAIKARLSEARPNDALIGEEYGNTPGAGRGSGSVGLPDTTKVLPARCSGIDACRRLRLQ